MVEQVAPPIRVPAMTVYGKDGPLSAVPPEPRTGQYPLPRLCRGVKVTEEEVAQHCTQEDAWVVIGGKAYDVTQWQKVHPGGALPLLAVAGGDATDAFNAMHPPSAWAALSKLYVGDVVPSTPPAPIPGFPAPASVPDLVPHPLAHTPSHIDSAIIADFRELARDIKAAGYFRPDPSFYVRRGLLLLAILGVIVAGVVCTRSTVLHLLSAVALGLWWNQANFIGHDSGHNAVTGNRQIDSVIGLFVGNVLTGISIGWWKRSHNVHHIVCNSVNYDPDCQHIPVFALSDLFFKSHFSFYHLRDMTFDALAQLLVSYQHLTFYPIMCIARLNLYIQSLLLLCSPAKTVDNRALEFFTMGLFWAWYISLLMQLPNNWERLAFFFVSHAMTGILHVQICMSHFAAPMYEGRRDAKAWLRTQLESSINITCHPSMDWFHGGLQFQIEHHVFPRVPRRHLRAISPAVRAFCERYNIRYVTLSFWDANVLTLKTMQQAAMKAKGYKGCGQSDCGPPSGQAAFLQSLLWDALNAKG